MTERFSSNLGMSQRFASWPTALIGIIFIKAALSLAVKPGSFLDSYSGISYLFLLFLATSFAIQNGMQCMLGSRPFWVFFATACGMWSTSQLTQVYFERVLRVETPSSSIADPMLFLHIVPIMAALAIFPHRNKSDQKSYRALINAFLVLFFWSALYAYIVFPYRRSASPTSYNMRFDILYLSENLVLVLALSILAIRAHGPWKSIYLHLFGASALYALSSAVANMAIDSGGYVNGQLYGLGLTASVCWFVWIPLRARQLLSAEAGTTPSNSESITSSWAIVAVAVISFPIAWELFQRDESKSGRMLRILIALTAIGCLACAAYIREHILRSELGSRLGLTDNRLHLAMKSGKCVAWDWDIKSGRDSWFGDLQTQFGIPSDTFVGRAEDFRRRVHPEDRAQVAKAVKDAMQNRKKYTAEFRLLWPDGTIRWVSAEGDFYYAANGEPVRMLGISVDITDRKLAEEALAAMAHRVIDAEECERNRIASDLHEDIGQRLALLAIEIERLKTDPPSQTAEMFSCMDAIWKQTLGILTDVKASAHELHSPRLDYLGIEAVMRSFCEEYSQRKGVEIHFRSHDLPGFVPPDISLCFFRVLQEALYNAVVHSGVRHFQVNFWATTDEFHLTVNDAGSGFDPKVAMKGSGIGLIGMKERLQLVKGTFSIESQPDRGSTIHACVPLGLVGYSIRELVEKTRPLWSVLPLPADN
jgi:PAS domain S-box-containing protein